MDCVRISLSWEGKKKKMHPLCDNQSEVSQVPIPLLSLLVRKGTLKSANDRCTDGWFDTLQSSQSVEGRTAALWE